MTTVVPSWRTRVANYARETLNAFAFRTLIAHWLVSLIPYGTFGNVRALIYRLAGFRKIAKTVWFHGTPTFRGECGKAKLLEIGERTSINTPCIWDLNGKITVGKNVGIGPESLFFTGSHAIGPRAARMGKQTSADIWIGDGVWIGARVTILPGVSIGAGAVIAAGSLINRDVEPNTLVGGVPARPIRSLDKAIPDSAVIVRGQFVNFEIERATHSDGNGQIPIR